MFFREECIGPNVETVDESGRQTPKSKSAPREELDCFVGFK